MSNRGVLLGASAYLMWGFFPAYFKALQAVPPMQILFHRVVWSFVFLAGVLAVRRDWAEFRKSALQPRVIATYALAAVLLATNWLVYVWGVNAGHVVETSLGYFINPLVSVALGVVLLKEKLRAWQWLPVGLAAAGVVYLTIASGAPPWIALTLALTFGLYGLLKKIAPLGALHGLSLETMLLFLPGLAYLLLVEVQGSGSFGHLGTPNALLLASTGVMTAIPLLMFASAARSIPLSLVGLLQYIAPTCQFLLGVLAFGEPFGPERVIGFSIIWAALVIYALEGLVHQRKKAAQAA